MDISSDTLAAAVKECRDGFVIADASTLKNELVFVNKAFTEMTGFRVEDLVGKGTRFLLGRKTRPSAAALFRRAIGEGAKCLVVISTVKADGNEFWNEISLSPIHESDGSIRYFVAVCKDVSARVHAQEALLEADISFEGASRSRSLSSFDELTSVYSRHYFEDYVEREWLVLQRQNRPLTLFMLEALGLESFSEQAGAAAEEELLKALADSVRQVFRRGLDLVARYDNSRFVIISSGMPWEEAEMLASRLRDKTAGSTAGFLSATESEAEVDILVGVVTSVPEPHHKVQDLIARAEEALRDARDKSEKLHVAEMQ